MSTDDTPATCGTCRFFCRGEIDPSTLKRDTRRREQLHVIAFPVGGPQGMGISVQTIYPHVPESLAGVRQVCACRGVATSGEGAV